jgi:membrane-associated protein
MSEWLSSLTDLQHMASGTAYLVLFALVFIETGIPIGFFLPGDSVLFTAGLLAARPDSPLSLSILVFGVLFFAIAGDSTGYTLGRRLGRPWLLRSAGRAARQVDRAERLYARYGWGAIVIARFIPWVRTFTPALAGIGAMSYRG